MIGFLKRPRSWKIGRLPVVVVTAVALTLGGCTVPPEAAPQANVVTASLPDGADVSVAFPGHDELNAEVEPTIVTPDMTAALPSTAAHISNLAEFTLTEGEFPESGAAVTFHRAVPPPSGSFSVIAHWNDVDKEWEPVQTNQSDDRLTLSATVGHFSAYSIIDFFQDVSAGYREYKSGGWDENGDPEGFEKAINGGGQWVGVQAAAPTCSDAPKPAWAEVLGATDLTNIITSCASGSRENPDNLIVRVTVNRSYAGYFHTAAEPVCAQQDGYGTGHLDSQGYECAPREPNPSGHVVDAGYVDWKAAGAMMIDEGLIALDDKADDANVYPVLPFSTYTFEFTKQALLTAWPNAEAQNIKLVNFDTEWWLSLSGLLFGVVDYAVAHDNGDGPLRYLVLALQINDCSKMNRVILQGKSGVPGADELLTIVNCLTAQDPRDAAALMEDLGIEIDHDDLKKPNALFDTFSKTAQKVFKFVAAASIGMTVGTAINDLTMADDADRAMYFFPAGDAKTAFAAGPWTRADSRDGKYQFLIPSGWEVAEGTDEYSQKESSEVLNAKGETMSTLVVGVPLGQGQNPVPQEMPYAKLNKTTIPVYGLRIWNEQTENLVVFHGVSMGDTWNARLGVSSFLTSDTEKAWARGFDTTLSEPPVGGYFGRSIREGEPLTDVSPSLTGLERLEAYEGTTEYLLTLTMLESLRDNPTQAVG